MFDIGFWEITVIAVVALLVVGPEEFPGLVRNMIAGVGKLRRFVGSVKNDLEHEIDKAEELKQLVAKEVKIAEMHDLLDKVNSPLAVPHERNSQADTEQENETTKHPPAKEEAKPLNSGSRHGSE